MLQRAVAMLLEAVNEQDFQDCSYGFRPGRSAHQALDALWQQTQVPQVTHHEVLPQPGQFRRLRLVLQRVWQAIRQGCVYPVATPQNCYGCTYQQACQGWEG